MLPYILHPIKLQNLNDLKKLTESMEDPIASLPNNKHLLKERIQFSLKSFSKKIRTPGNEYYLFALEHLPTKKIIGVSGIEARASESDYFFAYELQKETFSHPPLHIQKTVDVLALKTIKSKPSELCSLYLHPQYRTHGLGALLSLSRYLFIHTFPKRFSNELIANLRGYRDEQGQSPFWQAIGDIFFGGNLSTVDTMKSLGHKSFIRDLMPRHPIYIPLLPKNVQSIIGQVHHRTQPALHLLLKQGFKTGKWIDIFDAGPLASAKCKNIQILKNIKTSQITQITPSHKPLHPLTSTPNTYILSNHSPNFKSCLATLNKITKNKTTINLDIAKALDLKIGDYFSYYNYNHL